MAALRALARAPATPCPSGAPLPPSLDAWPLCQWSAEGAGRPLPPELAAKAQAQRLAVATRNLRLESLYRRVRAGLEDRGVPVVPIKGIALLGRYPSAGLRPMEDVDLLVPPDALERAGQVLLRRGFRLHDEGFPSPSTLPLVGPEGLSVDLHARLLNPRIPLWAALVDEPEGCWIELARGGALPLEAEFVLVAAHAMKHWLIRDRWLADLALLWGLGPDPARLLAAARATGMTCLVRTPLHVLAQVLGLRVSHRLLAAFGPLTAPEVTLLDGLTRGERDYRDRRLAHFLPMLPGAGARARVLVSTLLPSPREARERFGATSYPRFLLGRLGKLAGVVS